MYTSVTSLPNKASKWVYQLNTISGSPRINYSNDIKLWSHFYSCIWTKFYYNIVAGLSSVFQQVHPLLFSNRMLIYMVIKLTSQFVLSYDSMLWNSLNKLTQVAFKIFNILANLLRLYATRRTPLTNTCHSLYIFDSPCVSHSPPRF